MARRFHGACSLPFHALLYAALLGACPAERLEDEPSLRDLATIRPPGPMVLSREAITLNLQSAVPTFGPDASYIALLHKYDQRLWDALKDYPLFCAGPGRSHRVQMRVMGGETDAAYKTHLVWHCDWPSEEADAGCYDVFLEEATGRALGHFRTCYTPTLLSSYSTAACVTSVWDDPATGVHATTLLPQWMEFNRLNGVQHFLVYTMTGTDSRVMDIYRYYLDAGLATRVHLDLPEHFSKEYSAKGYSTQAWFANDCLYRLKYRAKWLLPTIDVDEYWRVVPTGQGTDETHKAWDDIEADWSWANVKERAAVHSISFGRYTFLRLSAADELQISSPWRESKLAPLCPKYVVKPSLVNALFIHWPTSWVTGAVALGVPASIGVANHYRTNNASTTTMKDSALVAQAHPLNVAIQARFHSPWKTLASKLSSASPASVLEGVTRYDNDERQNTEQRLSEAFRSWISDFNSIERTQIIVPPVSRSSSSLRGK